jgi:hypothetical protein
VIFQELPDAVEHALLEGSAGLGRAKDALHLGTGGGGESGSGGTGHAPINQGKRYRFPLDGRQDGIYTVT